MKKQSTLAFLVRNLDSWPYRVTQAPVVDGYRWVRGDDNLFLCDDTLSSQKTIEDMKITLHDWKVACLDSAAERTKESTVQISNFDMNTKHIPAVKLTSHEKAVIADAWDTNKNIPDIERGKNVPDVKPNDQVKNPSHYQIIEGFESITIIASALTVEQWKGFCIGNILKYRIRAGKKGDLKQDIDKADFYEELYEQHKHLCKV